MTKPPPGAGSSVLVDYGRGEDRTCLTTLYPDQFRVGDLIDLDAFGARWVVTSVHGCKVVVRPRTWLDRIPWAARIVRAVARKAGR